MSDQQTIQQLKAQIAQMEKALEDAKKHKALTFKVGEKGGVSVYGLGRFPVTLYFEQWFRLLDAAEALRAFITENKSKLSVKGVNGSVIAATQTPAQPAQ